MRRALFLLPTDKLGGAERVTMLVAEAALKSGAFDQVVFFILSRNPSGSFDSIAKNQSVRVIYTKARNEIWGLGALARCLMAQNYDLVFSSHTHLNAAAALFRSLRLLRTERLVTRESTLIFERNFGYRGFVIRGLYRFYGSQDLIVCQTNRMAESLAKNTGNRFIEKTKVVPNPVDLSCIKENQRESELIGSISRPGKLLIGWCGRLSPIKSPKRAIDVVHELRSKGRHDFHLVIIGDGPMREELQIYTKQLDLEASVTFMGYQENPAKLFRECHYGLMTSDIEGFPNVILEMLAAGVRAVITTDCAGGLSEIPCVHVADQPTAQCLSEKIVSVDLTSPLPRLDEFFEKRTPLYFLSIIIGSQ